MKRNLIVSIGAVALGLAAITLVAHAGSSRPGSGVTPGADRYQCFDPDFIQGFQTISDHKIVVTSHRDQAYELTLAGICLGLESSFQIGIRSRHLGDVCGPMDAEIVWNDGLRGMQSCRVSTMRHLQGDEAAQYVRNRSADKREQ